MAKWNRNPHVRADLTAQSINQVMAERILIHQMDLQRVGDKEGERIVRLLADAQQDIISQLYTRMARIEERGVDWGPVTTRRLREMEVALGQLIKNWGKKGYNTQRDFLVELARDELDYQKKLLDDSLPIKVEMVIPARQTLRVIVTTEPIGGTPLRKWWYRLENRAQVNLERAINLGMVEGETIDQIARRIRGTKRLAYKDGILYQTATQARAIARTGVNHVSNQARNHLYQENADIVKGVQWLATLDTRTCPTCMSLDGKQWPIESPHPHPPRHVACRCTSVPVLKSWRQLGIPAQELDDTTRASMDGQVAAKMTYPTWLKRQSTEAQNRALGPTRAREWRAGRIKVTQFVTSDGRLLTLDELRTIEGRKIPVARKKSKG